jgi:ATP-dependent helicase HrpA
MAYPSLVDEGGSVAVRVLDNEPEQRRAMRLGTRRLLMLGLGSPLPWVQNNLDNRTKLALAHNPHGSVTALLDDCVGCAIDHLVLLHGGPAWDDKSFAALTDRARAGIRDTTLQVVAQVARILALAQQAERQVAGIRALPLLPALADIKEQLSALIVPGFVTEAGWDRLPHLARYHHGVLHRLERLPGDPVRDGERMRRVREVQEAYQRTLDAVRPGRPVPDELTDVRWLIEEFRVSLFAQQLGTASPVSEKRIRRILADIRL